MRDEIIRRIKSNNKTIDIITKEIRDKKRLSVNDILKAASTIKHFKQINATYRNLLE
jgi:hypothetical protein